MTGEVGGEFGVLRCRSCDRHLLGPAYGCPACGALDLDLVRVPPEGSVLTFTVIRVPPPDFAADAPYAVLVAELAGGVRVTGRLEGAQEGLSIGMPVRLLRRDTTGYWFGRKGEGGD